MLSRCRALACVLALAGSSAPADVVHLKDGRTLEGDIAKTPEGWRITTADGKSVSVATEQVKSLEPKREPSADVAADRLASLRRSVQGMDDIGKILDRYDVFIRQYEKSPAANDARNDVTMWQDRRSQGMVKEGDKWLTPQERDALREQALAEAAKARDLMAQAKHREALAILDQALTVQPQNGALNYLRGVALFQQSQLVPSRKAFEAAHAALPNHGPTINNLAVVNWQTKQVPAALSLYDLAMQAAPSVRPIMDNVAEALYAVPEDLRATPTVKKVVKRFNEQDNLLASKLVKQNLYRWGSGWVTGEELDALQEQERRIKDKIRHLEDDFENVQDRIDKLNDQIRDTQRSMRELEIDSVRYDSMGRQIRIPPPRLYYDLGRELRDLQSERDEQTQKLGALRRKAQATQRELATPRYSGQQRLIGVEGAPLPPPQAEPANAAMPPIDPPAAGNGPTRRELK